MDCNLTALSAPWHMLNLDTKEVIFKQCRNSNNSRLKELLPLRLIDQSCKMIIESIVAHIFKPPVSDECSTEYLKQFGENCAIYSASDSKEFLNCFLYDHDCRKVYVANKKRLSQDPKKYVEKKLKKLKNTYHNPCCEFKVDSLCLPLLYRKHLKSKNIKFKLTKLEYYLTSSTLTRRAYSKMINTLLTEDLEQLIMHAEPDDFYNVSDGSKSSTIPKENFSKMKILLSGKILNKLSFFELNLSQDNIPMIWNEATSLNAADATALQNLMPNVRTLTFVECCFKKTFFFAFTSSSFLQGFESLRFTRCLLENTDSFENFLTSSNFSNLKCLEFPYFHKIGTINFYNNKLLNNTTLVNLETLIINNNNWNYNSINGLLFVLQKISP